MTGPGQPDLGRLLGSMTDPFEPLPFVPLEAAAASLGVELRSLTDEARVGRIDLAALQQGWHYAREEHLDVLGRPGWSELPSFHLPGEHAALPPGLVLLPADAGHFAHTRGEVDVFQVFDTTRAVRYTLVRPERVVVADLVLDRATYDRLRQPVRMGGATSTDPESPTAAGTEVSGTSAPGTADPIMGAVTRADAPESVIEPGQQPDADAAPPDPSMIRRDWVWTISYGGKQCRLHERIGRISISKGLRYLAELLKRPRFPVSAVELEAIINGKVLSRAEVVEAERGIPRIDEQAIRESGEALLRHQIGAEQARDDGRSEDAERLEALADEVFNYIRQNTNRHGTPRYSGGRGKQAGTNVMRAIGRVVQKLRDEKGMAELALHLEETIEGGRRPCYRPHKPPVWTIGID